MKTEKELERIRKGYKPTKTTRRNIKKTKEKSIYDAGFSKGMMKIAKRQQSIERKRIDAKEAKGECIKLSTRKKWLNNKEQYERRAKISKQLRKEEQEIVMAKRKKLGIDRYKRYRTMSLEEKVAREKAVRDYIEGRPMKEILLAYEDFDISPHWIRNKVNMSKKLKTMRNTEADRYTMIYDKEILYILRIRCFAKWSSWYMCQDSEEFKTNKVSEKDARFYMNAQQCVEGEILFFKGMIRAQIDKLKQMEKDGKDKGTKYESERLDLHDIQSLVNALLEFKKNPKIKKIVD